MIDICDFAVGLSRQLYGLTMPSERAGHKMAEYWHPMGVVGVISAFNFPLAVWSWNAALAYICGDSVVWKPSEKTPTHGHCMSATIQTRHGPFRQSPSRVCYRSLSAGAKIGNQLISDQRVPVISATGSTRMGRAIGTGCRTTLRPLYPGTGRQQRHRS